MAPNFQSRGIMNSKFVKVTWSCQVLECGFTLLHFLKTRERAGIKTWKDDKNRGDERGSYHNFFRPPRYHASKNYTL